MQSLFKTALLTGLFVGTTDLIAAFISQYIKTGEFAEKMLHYIAGGVLGLEASMQGGTGVAFLGLLFHYFIAFAFTLFFFLIFPYLKFLTYNKYLVGMLYGVFVAEAMRWIILPLTPLPSGGAFNLATILIGWYTLGAVLGIPIVYNTYKYYRVN